MSTNFALEEVQVALSPTERFEEYLQSRGKRVTRQRRMMVEQIFTQHDHFDADQLLANLQRTLGQRRVSRPTVYRTLSELVDAGLLRKMSLGGRAVYEHDYGYPQHDHLYCQQCEKLVEFNSEAIREIAEAAAREHGFRFQGHRFIVTGTCADCSRRKRMSRRVDLV
jgi:Fur family ferric uptake transcriptional regulator